MSEHNVCIIGPSPQSEYQGGVASHIRNLQGLECFNGAKFFDVGSVNSNIKNGYLNIIRNIFTLRKYALVNDITIAMVNSSIYSSSIIKLLLLILILPNIQIHIFFHGGRFESIGRLTSFFMKYFGKFFLVKVTSFYFLSNIQKCGFENTFGQYNTNLFCNYSNSNSILRRVEKRTIGTLKLLFVGRIIRNKGIFDIITALQSLSAQQPDSFTINFVGDGDDLIALKEKSKHFSDGVIQFSGFLSGEELEKQYTEADVLLLPTYHPEGFPYVFIEAMRAGLPVIATPVGALSTLVIDGVTGFQVKKEQPESIVEPLCKLLDNYTLLDSMSSSCKQFFLNHLNRSAAEKYYSGLIKNTNCGCK